MTARTYLDYNATAPVEPAALDAMAEAARIWANPSSVHGSGQRARALLETCRRRIAARIDVEPDQLFFTSGGTEAIDIVLRARPGGRTLLSAIEHDAVRARAPGGEVVPVSGAGLIDLEALATTLAASPAPQLLCVMHANNETGVVQPVGEVARLAAGAGARLLIDAVQSAGKLPLPRADYVAISAHKLGGPPGVGALIIRDPAQFEPTVKAAQERGVRGGTHNLPGIAGFAAALDARAADTGWLQRATALRDRVEHRLRAAVHGVGFPGREAPRLGTTSCIRLPGVKDTTQLMALDMERVEVSAGAACSSGKVTPSHVLRAMGLSETEAGEAIRVSLGWGTTAADIDRFLDAYLRMAARLTASRAA